MTERIVDVLEVIQIEEHDRDRVVAAMRERECVLHPVAEKVAIGQQRERVMEGELPQLLFERLALADVAEIEREPLNRRILGEVTADALEHAAPAPTLEAQLERAHRPGR